MTRDRGWDRARETNERARDRGRAIDAREEMVDRVEWEQCARDLARKAVTDGSDRARESAFVRDFRHGENTRVCGYTDTREWSS